MGSASTRCHFIFAALALAIRCRVPFHDGCCWFYGLLRFLHRVWFSFAPFAFGCVCRMPCFATLFLLATRFGCRQHTFGSRTRLVCAWFGSPAVCLYLAHLYHILVLLRRCRCVARTTLLRHLLTHVCGCVPFADFTRAVRLHSLPRGYTRVFITPHSATDRVLTITYLPHHHYTIFGSQQLHSRRSCLRLRARGSLPLRRLSPLPFGCGLTCHSPSLRFAYRLRFAGNAGSHFFSATFMHAYLRSLVCDTCARDFRRMVCHGLKHCNVTSAYCGLVLQLSHRATTFAGLRHRVVASTALCLYA